MNKQAQTGVAMIEMVIVTPLLLLLILGVAELGKAILQYNALTKSVRDAARFVAGKALLGTTGTVFITPDLEADAKNLVVYGDIQGANPPLLPSLSTSHVSVSVPDSTNNLILIQADYPYEPLIGPVLNSFSYGAEPYSPGLTLTATVTMRAL